MEQSTPTTAATARLHRIYVLMDAQENVRYVGITVQKLKRRFDGHMSEAGRGNKSYRSNWIRSLSEPPTILEIEQTFDTDREKFWIAHYRSIGAKLTNQTTGGEGLCGYEFTESHRASLSEAGKVRMRTDENRARVAAINKGKCFSAETRAKIGAAHRGKKLTEEHRRKIGEGGKGHCHSRPITPEHRAKLEAGRLAFIASDKYAAYCAKLKAVGKGRVHTAESLAKMSVAQKGKFVSEETRAKIRAHHVAQRESGWVSPLKGKPLSLEARAKQSATRKKMFANGYVNPRKGVLVSDDMRLLLTTIQIGRKASESTKAKMRQSHALRRKKLAEQSRQVQTAFDF